MQYRKSEEILASFAFDSFNFDYNFLTVWAAEKECVSVFLPWKGSAKLQRNDVWENGVVEITADVWGSKAFMRLFGVNG